MFMRCLHADFYKMKRSPVLVVHIVIPIIVSVMFLFYYAVSGGSFDEADKIMAFYETLGVSFPILIGIFTASTMEQEQNAGAFQNLLTLKSKTAALFSKVVVLVLFSIVALILSAVLFGYGFESVLGQGSAGMGVYIAAALLIWLAGIPLYIWHTILAYLFGKGVTIGAGFFSGLISALLLTDLGMYIWKIVPFSWTARMPEAYLGIALGNSVEGTVAGSQLPANFIIGFAGLGLSICMIYLVFLALSLVCYFGFARNYEGSRIVE